MGIKYIMVTNFEDHWDKIRENKTSYPIKMLKGGMNEQKISKDIETLFIKLEKTTRSFRKAWVGKISDYEIYPDKSKIFFHIQIEKELPDIPNDLKMLTEGWYLKDWNLRTTVVDETQTPRNNITNELEPAFFERLSMTTDFRIFEDDVYNLLKLLGIHEIFKYKQQRGKEDGFFRFEHLAIKYDATLEESFEENKQTQIENYYSQIKNDRVKHKNKTIDIQGCRKQIWIITRGKTRLIDTINQIEIKEISIKSLIELYSKRVVRNLDSVDLEKEFGSLQ